MATGAPKRPDGRQARWSQHNAARRERIIDAAIAEIEATEPGTEVHVQQIAARAGLSRSVVYRHFTDRTDLDTAVQGRILDELWAALTPSVTLEGTIPEIIERIISVYVGWATSHPSLHAFAQSELPAGGDGPLEAGLLRIAGQITELIDTVIELLEIEGGEELRPAVDPLVFGLVGLVFGAVRRWLGRSDDQVSVATLVTLLSDTVWHALAGHAATFGVTLERDRRVEELLGLGGEGTTHDG